MSERPAAGWWIGWGVALVAAAVASFVGAAFLAAALHPHAFGGRDGEGAAGLVVLILLITGGIAVVAEIAAVLVGLRLRARLAKGWPLWVSLGVPGSALALGLLVGVVG